MEKKRIQKLLSEVGICSRRRAEVLIKENKVKVNGKTAKLGDKADFKDAIKIEDVSLNLKKNVEKIYVILNKPKGYLTTMKDEKNRKTVMCLINGFFKERIYPVGRLDLNSQGLLLLTNDGEFANFIMHPSSNIKKTYEVVVNKPISKEEIIKMRDGVLIDGKITAKSKIKILNKTKEKTKFLITIHEGKKRQIRKMVSIVMNCRVLKLNRIKIGPLKLEELKIGEFKKLSLKEVLSLKKELNYEEA